jgi:hypothetical protein
VADFAELELAGAALVAVVLAAVVLDAVVLDVDFEPPPQAVSPTADMTAAIETRLL